MKPNTILQRMVVMLITLMCAIGANAAEAYACYTPENNTLTFYYDDMHRSRPGMSYDLNTNDNYPGWYNVSNSNVTKVVFDPSFAGARPTTTYSWFSYMRYLSSIEGMSYLNTSEVTNMAWMFSDCFSLKDIDLSHFNTAKVTDMARMFSGCEKLTSLDLTHFNTSKVTSMSHMFSFSTNLQTIYVVDGWNMEAVTVTSSSNMFYNCKSLVGGKGTTYDANYVDKEYAHIDGGSDNPGYFTVPIEAYACYTSDNTTLTFYYDDQRSTRTGRIYNLNKGGSYPGWIYDSTPNEVTEVVFDLSFVDARPTSTCGWFRDMDRLRNISYLSRLNTSQVTNMDSMFERFYLRSLDLSNFDTSNVTSMNKMFSRCINLKHLDISSFNTSNVTDMYCMFELCGALTTLDVRNFDTSKVTNMGDMFDNCHNLTTLDLRHFNTSKVTIIYGMFEYCYNLQCIAVGSNWNTGAVTNSKNMFLRCESLVGGNGTIYNKEHTDAEYAHIDGGTSNPGYFSEIPKEAYACYTPENTTLTFYYDKQRSTRTGTTYDLNTYPSKSPAWQKEEIYRNVTKVVFNSSFSGALPTTTCEWFRSMNKLESIEGMNYLNTSEVTNMAWMFTGCSLTTFDLSSFNTSKVTNMEYMFYFCKSLTTLDISSFNTSNVTNMDRMFYDCESLTTLDLSSFNTSNVTNMDRMFYDCINLRTIYVGDDWTTNTVMTSSQMFEYCTSLVGGQGTTFDANHIDKAYAHIDGGNSNPGYFTNAIPRHAYACYTPENTTLTFYCDRLQSGRPGTTYDLNTGINTPGWCKEEIYKNVTKVVFDSSFADILPTTTYFWFYGMMNLETIEGMSNLSTSEVKEMSYMFDFCYKLTSLDLSGFNTRLVAKMDYMFNQCTSLRTIYVGDGWTTSAVTSSRLMFNKCTSLVGGQGTTYNADYVDMTYAHIDGGPSNPGYLRAFPAGIATGIENVQRDADKVQSSKFFAEQSGKAERKVQSDEWFTIDGQKLSGKPTKKGVYIHNGRAVVL